jgi:hypothetical protein
VPRDEAGIDPTAAEFLIVADPAEKIAIAVQTDHLGSIQSPPQQPQSLLPIGLT